MATPERFRIAQFSDIHCGDPRFDAGLMENVITRVNAMEPDLVLIPGDLTVNGYPDEFELAREWIDRVECPHVAVLIGNHDARKVGYVHFERIFGDRYATWDFSLAVPCASGVAQGVSVIGLDSSKPDLDDGEIGRHRHRWLAERLDEAAGRFSVVALHHHLVSIPGTGRERNVVWDAGEVLEILADHEVDLVVAGHKHVPYTWPVADMLVVTSGTATTWRTRGTTPPSFTSMDVTCDAITVNVHDSANGVTSTASFARRAKS